MSDEVQAATRPSVAPVRFEPDSRMVDMGSGVGRDLYRSMLPAAYVGNQSANRAFSLDRLYADGAQVFSNGVLKIVGASVNSLFGYDLSSEDSREINEVVKGMYVGSKGDPEFQLTTAQVLVATLRVANGLLGPKAIEKSKADAAAVGLEVEGDQESKRCWASFFMGVANGLADQLTGGPDAISERRRVEELEKQIENAEEGLKRQGGDIKEGIEYGLKLREETAESLRQFGGEVWR